jgi:hypothetical protein
MISPYFNVTIDYANNLQWTRINKYTKWKWKAPTENNSVHSNYQKDEGGVKM